MNHLEDYEVGNLIGEGTSGQVMAATVRGTGQLVAIKRIKLDVQQEGVRGDVLREIRLLQELQHPNVLQLVDCVVSDEREIFVVYERLDANLEQVIQDERIVLTIPHIKRYMVMLLQGMAFLHANYVLHRDIKPDNLMFSNAARQLKFIDFGLARSFGSPGRPMTPNVVTIYYKAPELLFMGGARGHTTHYGVGVDMWAVGCVFGELLLRRPLFVCDPPHGDLQQLQKVFSYLGTPTESDWPGMGALPSFVEFTTVQPMKWSKWLPAAAPDAVDLLKSLLVLDPRKRFTAEQALAHPFFRNRPEPTPIDQLPLPTTFA